ncbi:MAG: glycoside hydrolase family 43 protein [Bacteroidota bacterium]|nr:glycoside hydrolase family 43 protein [Bacteroidota bacterium]
MKTVKFFFIFLVIGPTLAFAQKQEVRDSILLDSIRLSDPFILADKPSKTYYMTGTGGKLWKSKDLAYWTGPFNIVEHDTASWMGKDPMIWAAEIHQYKDQYYYFATFTNQEVFIDTVKGSPINRRASHVLVSDKPDGPYKPMADATYLPPEKPTLDGTLWVSNDHTPYMIYCHEWLQNLDGTMEKIERKPDLSGSIGEGEILFRASDSPWSRDKRDGKIMPNMVTDGPFVFRTQTGKLGMLWTSWIYGDYTQGIAYSESGTINGAWIQEKEPITPPNYGHGMLFKTFDGQLLMSLHSHRVGANGNYIRHPKLFRVDDSGDKIVVEKSFDPIEEK